jgi:hypothetical protein
MRVIAIALAAAATIVMLLAAVFLTGLLSGPVAEQIPGPSHWIPAAAVVLGVSVLLVLLFLRLGRRARRGRHIRHSGRGGRPRRG